LWRLCGDISTYELAPRLSAAAHRDPPFHRTVVGDFLRGEVTTYEMMAAFLALFPEMPPPVFFASSYEEAHRLQQVARQYEQESAARLGVARVEKTVESTGEKTRTGKTTRGRRRKMG
jgi:hypothetical protein